MRIEMEEDKELFKKELERISLLLNKNLTILDYKQNCNKELSFDKLLYKFGRWSDALDFAGLPKNPHKSPPSSKISLIDLDLEFWRVYSFYQRPFNKREFKEYSKYSWASYIRRFGSWSKCLNFYIDHEIKNTVSTERKLLGGIPVPTNEQETILYFFKFYLKYVKVHYLQSNFPDSRLELMGVVKDVEFEYKSSSFIQHGHPLNFDGIVICWIKDKELPCKIFELSNNDVDNADLLFELFGIDRRKK